GGARPRARETQVLRTSRRPHQHLDVAPVDLRPQQAGVPAAALRDASAARRPHRAAARERRPLLTGCSHGFETRLRRSSTISTVSYSGSTSATPASTATA